MYICDSNTCIQCTVCTGTFSREEISVFMQVDKQLMSACLQSAADMNDVKRLLRVMVKLDQYSLASSIDLSPHSTSQWYFELFEESLRYAGRNSMTR